MADPQFEVSDGKGGLKIESLRKSYQKRLVISDVSMHLHRGEVVALLGPNGSGKTTMINMISGVHKPSDGRIALRGRLISDQQPQNIARAGIGRTFQLVRLLPGLTVLENVMAGAVYGHRRGSRARRTNRTVTPHLPVTRTSRVTWLPPRPGCRAATGTRWCTANC